MPQRIYFGGINLNPGDRAKWVRTGSPSCESIYDASYSSTIDSNSSAKFYFWDSGPAELCYKFYFLGERTPSDYVLFKGVRAAVVGYDDVLPRGVARGCAALLTIIGSGYKSLTDADPDQTFRCSYPALGWSVAATQINDTHLQCISPASIIALDLPLRIEVARSQWEVTAGDALTSFHPDTFPDFKVYAPEDIYIGLDYTRQMYPRGGSYNKANQISLHGSFADFGVPRCRFTSLMLDEAGSSLGGIWEGNAGVVMNESCAQHHS